MSEEIFQIQQKVPCKGSIKRKLIDLEAITKFNIHLVRVSALKQGTSPETANFSIEATKSQKTYITIT